MAFNLSDLSDAAVDAGSAVRDTLDPTYTQEQDPEAVGENVRPHVSVDPNIGARAISDVQPTLEGKSLGGFRNNLLDNAGDMAQGMWNLGTYPIRHPLNTLQAAEHPIDTAEAIGSTLLHSYKENYTPQPNESIPGMILRRLYEKPIDTLMDASLVGQLAFGGVGEAASLAGRTASTAVEGGKIGESLVKFAGGALAEAPEEALAATRRAVQTSRIVDLSNALTERAKRLDPLSIAQDAGRTVLKMVSPDAAAALKITSRTTDALAERTAMLKAAEGQAKQLGEDAVKDLNPAERMVFHPYVAGRVNFDRPVGKQLMMHTGEWAPVKGDVIRPDALEAARQKYLSIQQDLAMKHGLLPEQAAQTAGESAMNSAREALGAQFDPMHPAVQQYVQDEAVSASRKAMEDAKIRATGEMRTALDIAKNRSWKTEVESMVANNTHATIKDAETALPLPDRTTPDEAMALMGPQGGIYWPHSAETSNRSQSTIKDLLGKMGQASAFKENKFALFATGATEHMDPVQDIMRAYASYDRGRTWVDMAHEAVKKAVGEGNAERMPKDWNPHLDPDVHAGTHQPFDPGHLLTNEMGEDDAQRLLSRYLETPEESGKVDIFESMQKLLQGQDNGPMYKLKADNPVYKISSQMGHSIADIKQALAPSTNPLVRSLDTAMGYWNWANLNLRATRIVNRIVGHSVFAAMQGVHPFSMRGISALVATGRAMVGSVGLGGEEARRLSGVFDLPGIRTGGLESSLTESTYGVGGKLAESTNPVARFFGKASNAVSNTAASIDAGYRAASLFYEMSPNAIQRAQRMFGHMAEAPSLGEKIAAFEKMGGQATMKLPEYRQALRGVERFFGDYNRSTPLERMMWRRITPYYKFIKHSTELAMRFPFEHPLQGVAMRAMGQAATQDVKDQVARMGFDWKRDVPDQLKDAIPLRTEQDPTTGNISMLMYNTKGVNPFSHMTGHFSDELLSSMAPWLKVAVEQATGVNLFTRERYRGANSSMVGREVGPNGRIQDTFTHPSMGEAVLRQFWPYQVVRDVVANGRVPTDTAGLLDMATNAPDTWQYDERGFPRRKGSYTGPLQPLARIFGRSPARVEQQTPGQRKEAQTVVDTQLSSLLQRYPNQRDRIMAALEKAAGDQGNE